MLFALLSHNRYFECLDGDLLQGKLLAFCAYWVFGGTVPWKYILGWLTGHHSLKVDGKTTLNGCWPRQVLTSQSILLCSHRSALPCQSQDVHSQLFCLMCTTKEQKTHWKQKARILPAWKRLWSERLYKDRKWHGHSQFFRPYMKMVFNSTFTYILCGIYSEGKKNKNKLTSQMYC